MYHRRQPKEMGKVIELISELISPGVSSSAETMQKGE